MKELKVSHHGGNYGYWFDTVKKTYTAICLMSPTAKYFVGDKYNSLEEAKEAFIQKQTYWNEKNEKEGFRTLDFQTLINKNEEE